MAYDNPSLGAGYVTKSPAMGIVFRRGHGTATLMALAAFALWLVTGWFALNIDLGYPKWVFTLSYVVMLILLLCAVLPGLTFFFDKYRMPVLLPILALPLSSGHCARSDHFFQLQNAAADPPPPPAKRWRRADVQGNRDCHQRRRYPGGGMGRAGAHRARGTRTCRGPGRASPIPSVS